MKNSKLGKTFPSFTSIMKLMRFREFKIQKFILVFLVILISTSALVPVTLFPNTATAAGTDILVEATITVSVSEPQDSPIVSGPYTVVLSPTNAAGTGNATGPTDTAVSPEIVLAVGDTSASVTIPFSGPYSETWYQIIIQNPDDPTQLEASRPGVLLDAGSPANLISLTIDESSPLFGVAVVDPSLEQEEIDRSCFSGGLLAWALCPLIKGMFEFIEFIYRNVVLTSLVIDPLDPDSTDPATVATFEIWNNFRVIANVLLFIVFILAIFGQGLAGFQVFSAYEFKKIVPRLVIGTIGVQLSFYLVGFAVDAFNVLGTGIRALMLAPVEGLQWGDFDFGTVADVVGLVLGGSAAWIARFAVGKVGFLYALPLILIPIAIALLTTILVLLFRKMIIFLLIVISPVAFVMGILPGFDRWLKQWWDLLWKALFMFPLIIAFIAAGELVAKILVAGNEASAVNQIMGIIALFAPYFMIPATFKLAGNAVGAIAGGVNNMSGGLKNKILGEAHDPGSIRGRGRAARKLNREERSAAFMRRNRPGQFTMPRLRELTSKQGRKDFKTRRQEAWQAGKERDTMERQYTVPTKTGKNPFTGWGTKKKVIGGAASSRTAGVAGALGGVAASFMSRFAGATSSDMIGKRMSEGIETAMDMYETDDSMPVAAFGFDINPATGEAIDLSYQKAVTKGMQRDTALMTGFLVGGFLTAGTGEVTHRWREQLKELRDSGEITHDQAQQIWENATFAVKNVLPNLMNMDLETGEWNAKKIVEGVQKDTGRTDAYARNNFFATHWDQQKEAWHLVNDGTVGQYHNDAEVTDTKINLNRDRYSAINDLERQLPYYSGIFREAQAEIIEARREAARQAGEDPNSVNTQVRNDETFEYLNQNATIRGAANPIFDRAQREGRALRDDETVLALVRAEGREGDFRNASQLPETFMSQLAYLEDTSYFDTDYGDGNGITADEASSTDFTPQRWGQQKRLAGRI